MPVQISGLPLATPSSDWVLPMDNAAGNLTAKVTAAGLNALSRSQAAFYPSLGGSVSWPTITINRAARWIREGNQVWVFGHIAVTSASGGSGNLFITGLPFRVATRAYGELSMPGAHPGCLGVTKNWAGTPPTEIIAWPNTFQLNLAIAQTASAPWSFLPVSALAAGVEINFSVSYLTND